MVLRPCSAMRTPPARQRACLGRHARASALAWSGTASEEPCPRIQFKRVCVWQLAPSLACRGPC